MWDPESFLWGDGEQVLRGLPWSPLLRWQWVHWSGPSKLAKESHPMKPMKSIVTMVTIRKKCHGYYRYSIWKQYDCSLFPYETITTILFNHIKNTLTTLQSLESSSQSLHINQQDPPLQAEKLCQQRALEACRLDPAQWLEVTINGLVWGKLCRKPWFLHGFYMVFTWFLPSNVIEHRMIQRFPADFPFNSGEKKLWYSWGHGIQRTKFTAPQNQRFIRPWWWISPE